MEPTGHYWFNLGKFLQDNDMKPVLVNPHHVKKSKELDDNSQTKNDRKDPKVIAGLVKEGCYMIPYLPDGVYADLRTASNMRFQLQAELTRIQNRINRWFSIYFPEYKTVYGKPDAISGMMDPVDNALSVCLDRADRWGWEMKEGDIKYGFAENGKVQVMVFIDNSKKSELVFRFSDGKQLLNTDFYVVESKLEVIFDNLEIKSELKRTEIKENIISKSSVLKEGESNNKIKSIIYLCDVGILSEKERDNIISYLNGEVEMMNIELFESDYADFDDEWS